ncbi:MAG: hypothetical protein L3J63_06255, partial [Geopsychrobacter sp.]|nr:hypothetical protein [Geopsychrobacter sp.]
GAMRVTALEQICRANNLIGYYIFQNSPSDMISKFNPFVPPVRYTHSRRKAQQERSVSGLKQNQALIPVSLSALCVFAVKRPYRPFVTLTQGAKHSKKDQFRA